MKRVLTGCWILFLLALALIGLGCGLSNSSSSSSTMSASQASAVAASIAQAATHTAAGSPSGSIVIHSHPQSINCNASGCQIYQQFSSTFACSLGGNVGVTGDISGGTNASGTGVISIQGTETLTSCSPVQGVTLNGAPYISLAGNFSFVNGNPGTQQSIVIGGGFSWGSSATQICSINLTANFNGNGSGDLSGTLCGQSVNTTFD
jgi:hypothetical protein